MSARVRLALIWLLVTVAVLGAATATPWTINPPRPAPQELDMPARSAPTASASAAPPALEDTELVDNRWLLVIGAILLALLVAALLTYATRHLVALLRQRPRIVKDKLTAGTTAPPQDTAVDLPELQDAVTRAMTHLEGHSRPRDAVVAAWVALEDAAARAGTHRDRAQTPTEFAGTVLAATPAPPTAVARLRTLYQRARFTDRPIDRTAVDAARAALTEIATSLDVTTPETTTADPAPETTHGPA